MLLALVPVLCQRLQQLHVLTHMHTMASYCAVRTLINMPSPSSGCNLRIHHQACTHCAVPLQQQPTRCCVQAACQRMQQYTSHVYTAARYAGHRRNTTEQGSKADLLQRTLR
jgi:predicted amidophosphoribosyltransferase